MTHDPIHLEYKIVTLNAMYSEEFSPYLSLEKMPQNVAID